MEAQWYAARVDVGEKVECGRTGVGVKVRRTTNAALTVSGVVVIISVGVYLYECESLSIQLYSKSYACAQCVLHRAACECVGRTAAHERGRRQIAIGHDDAAVTRRACEQW